MKVIFDLPESDVYMRMIANISEKMGDDFYIKARENAYKCQACNSECLPEIYIIMDDMPMGRLGKIQVKYDYPDSCPSCEGASPD